MSKTNSPSPGQTSLPSAPLLAASAAIVLLAAAALAGWLIYGDGIYMALVDGLLAWCM